MRSPPRHDAAPAGHHHVHLAALASGAAPPHHAGDQVGDPRVFLRRCLSGHWRRAYPIGCLPTACALAFAFRLDDRPHGEAAAFGSFWGGRL